MQALTPLRDGANIRSRERSSQLRGKQTGTNGIGGQIEMGGSGGSGGGAGGGGGAFHCAAGAGAATHRFEAAS